MMMHGTLGSVGLGYTDSKIVNGVPAILVGDTYLPANVIITDKGAYPTPSTAFGQGKTAWYEVWQNGNYVGYLRPGSKNGLFKAEGSQIVWATPAAPEPVRLVPPDVKTPTLPAPQGQKELAISNGAPAVIPRAENIPVIQTAAYTPGSTTGTSITELPAASALQPLTDAPAAVDATVQQAGFSWPMMLLIGGAGLGLLFGGKKGRGTRRGKRYR